MTRNRSQPKWQRVHPSVVRRQIAAALLGRNDDGGENARRREKLSETIGQIKLRAHQQDAFVRLKAAIENFGGALLADAVGLGKTYVALAVAREYPSAHILAPATLLPMWRSAIADTESRNATLHSLHRLSRGPATTSASSERSLLIVDEAHHLRTRSTVRYRNAVAFSANRDVLLLTATPLHNRPNELRNLLALFLGHRADALDKTTLAQCIVRRTESHVTVQLPSVLQLPPHRLPGNEMVLECLLTLPPPLPVHDGATASALVRLGLLRAWCSSDAALSDTIRRRQLRGEALMHSLVRGRYPTQRELQSWIVGSDSMQLGFPELLVRTTTGDTGEMLTTLLAHLDGLQALMQLHTKTSVADARRAELLRSLVGNEGATQSGHFRSDDRDRASANRSVPPPAIVAFSQFASTVRALHRALSDLAGVASLTATGGRIASGAIAKHELIAHFAPKANGRPPPPAHERIRLLLTTDLLAEGVNLQDAGVVVHLDLPWTHALRQQRVGRVVRMGSSHSEIHVHTLEPPMGGEAALRITATLERKAGLHEKFVGSECTGRGRVTHTDLSGADEATALRELLNRWRNAVHAPCASRDRSMGTSVPAEEDTLIATVNSVLSGWIAVVKVDGRTRVVAQCDARSQSLPIIGSDTTVLLCATRAIEDAAGDGEEVQQIHYECLTESAERVRRELYTHLQTDALKEAAGLDARAIAPVQKNALDLLSSRITQLSALKRATLTPLFTKMTRSILRCRGAGAELALKRWIDAGESLPTATWLESFAHGIGVDLAEASDTRRGELPRPRVTALLLMQSSQPTSTSR